MSKSAIRFETRLAGHYKRIKAMEPLVVDRRTVPLNMPPARVLVRRHPGANGES